MRIEQRYYAGTMNLKDNNVLPMVTNAAVYQEVRALREEMRDQKRLTKEQNSILGVMANAEQAILKEFEIIQDQRNS